MAYRRRGRGRRRRGRGRRIYARLSRGGYRL